MVIDQISLCIRSVNLSNGLTLHYYFKFIATQFAIPEPLIMVCLDPGILSRAFFVHLQFYLFCMGKIVNGRRIVCGRLPGSRYK